MSQKFLSPGVLALLQIAIVANLQILPANASYGAALPFFYLLAILGFFLPCTLMVAELATTRPQTGGAYIWCEQAFGPKVGFFTISILWISNLLWYPSAFSLVATNIAYLLAPHWAENRLFIIGSSVAFFWFLTGLNCIGVNFSSRASVVCSIIGIILPILLIILSGFTWWLSGKPAAISFNQTTLLPNLSQLSNFGLLIAVVISLFGVEMTAVHAGNVINPRRNYPRSLLISGVIILMLLILAELAIAIIVPTEKLSVMTGLLDTVVTLSQELHLPQVLPLVLLLILLGNIGSITAWMLGSTRGMHVACQKNHVAKFLQKTNQYEAPIGVLVFEAILFTLISMIFLLFPRIADSFWLLLALASQITLAYYIILFISAIRLRYLPRLSPGFIIPGGNFVLWSVMLLGAGTSFVALLMGFMPPSNLSVQETMLFRIMMGGGLFSTLLLPVFLLTWKRKK